MYKVLIVDDEYPVKIVLRDIIMNSGLAFTIVGEAESGVDALRKIEQSNPQLVITDIMMPEMDGLELIRNVRDRGWNTEMAIISGYDEFQYAQQAIQYGVKRYWLKPLEEEQVVGYLRELQMTWMQSARESSEANEWIWFCKSYGERLAESIWTLHEQEVAALLEEIRATFAGRQLKAAIAHKCYTQLLHLVYGEINERSHKSLKSRLISITETGPDQQHAEVLSFIEAIFLELRQMRQFGRHRKVQAALDRIRQAYADEHVSLSDIAEHVDMSPSHLSMLLTEETGKGFTQLLTDMRMGQAALLLLNKADLRTYEVALEVGFSDYSYFTKKFRKYYGMTPTQYRQRMGMS